MYQNQTPQLESIGSNRYENIFHVNQTEENGYYFYNILRTVRLTSTDLDEKFYFKFNVNRIMPYTALSYNFYGTTDLWWLICVINNIDNPIEFIEPGTTILMIKKQHISTVISAIKSQLQ